MLERIYQVYTFIIMLYYCCRHVISIFMLLPCMVYNHTATSQIGRAQDDGGMSYIVQLQELAYMQSVCRHFDLMMLSSSIVQKLNIHDNVYYNVIHAM